MTGEEEYPLKGTVLCLPLHTCHQAWYSPKNGLQGEKRRGQGAEPYGGGGGAAPPEAVEFAATI